MLVHPTTAVTENLLPSVAEKVRKGYFTMKLSYPYVSGRVVHTVMLAGLTFKTGGRGDG